MRTILVALSIWLLINVLFVLVMIPARKPWKSSHQHGTSGSRSPALIKENAEPSSEEDDSFSLRHVVLAIGLGVFFSLTPPLLQAYDVVDEFVNPRRSRRNASATHHSLDQHADEVSDVETGQDKNRR
ncbi:hypothetical protein ACRQ5Q_07325 [Bradyrhizobium sp. PMVTL-01]|uniref:hypothetical protein n=1 Tax=Bradyrhizobium sp. PMVTL-01 TaxID=3434999 RepID=UPI003F70E274